MKIKWYGILFLFVITVFTVAPTVQFFVTGESAIVLINEVNEEENKTNQTKENTKDLFQQSLIFKFAQKSLAKSNASSLLKAILYQSPSKNVLTPPPRNHS